MIFIHLLTLKVMKNPEIVRKLFSSRTPITDLINLKFLNYEIALKKITQSIKFPKAKLIIDHKGHLVDAYSELRDVKNIENSNQLEGELAWYMFSILKYKSQINNFIELESDFQKEVLLGNSTKAFDKIEEINKGITYSYWSMENEFSIYQEFYGVDKNWEFLNKINETFNVPLSQLFSTFFSKKAEKEISILQYNRELESLVSGVNSQEGEFMSFKLGNLVSTNISNFSFILNTEGTSSIIDKYLTLIDVLFQMSLTPEYLGLVKKIIHDLKKANIHDSRIDRISEQIQTSPINFFNVKILDLFDIYTVGEYKNSLEKSINLIKEFPECIELYEIYIKSLLELELEFQKTNISEIIDQILLNLYSIFKRDEGYYNAKENLLKLSLSFPKLNLFKQVLSLVTVLTEDNSSRANSSYFIYSTYSNPNNFLSNEIDLVDIGEDLFKKHISIRVNYFISKNKFDLLSSEKIPQVKLDLYKARTNYFHDKDSKLEILINLKNNPVLNNYYKEEVNVYVNKTSLKQNKLGSLVSFFVDSYFENKYLIERINHEYLIEKIVDSDYDLDIINIDLPIYFHIQDLTEYYQYVSLELYLDSLSIEKPSEIPFSHLHTNDKTFFLLKKVCSIDVLNYFYSVYESESEVIEERIKILRIIANIDKENSSSYFEEIATLTQKLKIKEVIETVNDGKISLNFSRIKKDKEYNLENNYNRYKKVRVFSEDNGLNLVDISSTINTYLSDIKTDSSKLLDAPFVSFKTLFFEIVDSFLFSKEHGLEGDISTRIRHGVLENQLRSVFINNNLIAIKNIKDEYNDIDYWLDKCNQLSYKDELSNRIQNSIKEFSNSTDLLIINLIKEKIQIQSNRHRAKFNGFFNYRFPDEYLWIIYNEQLNNDLNYEDFINYIFDFIELHTTNLLKEISEKLRTDVNNGFQKELIKLQDKIKSILPKGGGIFSELNQAINNTKTHIQNELYDVSKWFKISNNSNNSVLDIDTIIHTAVESINIINSDKIQPKITIDKENLYNGGFFYIDIFKILLENSINHSKLEDNNISVDVKNLVYTTENKSQYFSKNTITITNDLSESICLDELDLKLTSIKSNWTTDLSTVNQEGGSGLQKIKRILKYDIQVIDSLFNFNIVENQISIILEIINIYIPNKNEG